MLRYMFTLLKLEQGVGGFLHVYNWKLFEQNQLKGKVKKTYSFNNYSDISHI